MKNKISWKLVGPFCEILIHTHLKIICQYMCVNEDFAEVVCVWFYEAEHMHNKLLLLVA